MIKKTQGDLKLQKKKKKKPVKVNLKLNAFWTFLPSQMEVGGSAGVGVGQIRSLMGQLDPTGNN